METVQFLKVDMCFNKCLILPINNDFNVIFYKYTTLNDDASIITISDLKDIINDPSNSSLRIEK